MTVFPSGQDDRIEELRDTHRLESASQSEQIEKFRRQLEGAEALLKASRNSSSHAEEAATKHNAEIDRLQAEVKKANELAKEEEEKRVKAISLLKTVRQKLVKAEKDRDDAVKELNSNKDKEKAEREKERVERTKLQHEIDSANDERQKAAVGLKAQFDKEVASLKECHEKEVSALRGQLELEAVTTKVRICRI
jgi:chromosome segregation ATPase